MLRFAHLASSGVQQGDPLSPLLFSLVLMQFIDFAKLHNLVKVHLWYLVDGTFVGSRSSLLQLLDSFTFRGPQFGLHLIMSKCELQYFDHLATLTEFPTNIKRVNQGLELLGSPILGTTEYFDKFLSSCLAKVVAVQDSIAILEDPQVELYLLCNCLVAAKLSTFFVQYLSLYCIHFLNSLTLIFRPA